MSNSKAHLPPFLLTVARGEQELGSWPQSEVLSRIADGRLQASDYFWREGMSEWRALGELSLDGAAPAPALTPNTFPVAFGSAYGVDKFGFVGSGELLCSDDTVELRGRRHWPFPSRLGFGCIAWLILAWLFFVLGDIFPTEPGAGVLVHGMAILTKMMALIGTPFLAMMLTHYLCASPAKIVLSKSQLDGIARRGTQINFTAPDAKSGKTHTSLFRARNAETAESIERQLRARGRDVRR